MKAAADLSNVTNPDMFRLLPAAQNLLVQNGFAVVPGQDREFFMLYEMSRYRPVPLLVTTDSLLHNYHLFFDHLLRMVETESLVPVLRKLNGAMLARAQEQYAALKGTAWENAARRNVGFFAVGSKLLDPSVAVPKAVEKEVADELDLIASHQGIVVSPLLNLGGSTNPVEALKEDYSQYVPRGHYDTADDLKAYFRTMMWYGRMTFRLSREDEMRSAALIVTALDQGDNAATWNMIYDPTTFFVGESDDIGYFELDGALRKAYGAGTAPTLQTLVSDAGKWRAFLDATARLAPPAINSIPIFDEIINPDREKEIKGFRFMGQRFTLDASIFQRLVYREVKENSQGQRRMLPRGLDIPAALGSQEAYAILESMGETGYANYPENMAKMRKYIAGLDRTSWTQNLYWGWLYALRPLLAEKPAGYPAFMRGQAWTRKELNTFLGNWAELKHDTILYAKQIYAEAGGGMDKVDDRGYVEPYPDLYARLAALAKATTDGLAARNLLSEQDAASLDRLEKLTLSLKTISEKELAASPLTDAEYDLIRGYGVQLEHFWLEALKDQGVVHRGQSGDKPAALVADVATNPNGSVLEEATGYVNRIYALVPVDGKLRIAVGGVYSYYEFPWPLNDRLTDSRWHEMLNEVKAPSPPEWTAVFIAP